MSHKQPRFVVVAEATRFSRSCHLGPFSPVSANSFLFVVIDSIICFSTYLYSIIVVCQEKFYYLPEPPLWVLPFAKLWTSSGREHLCGYSIKLKIRPISVLRFEGFRIRRALLSSHPGVNYLVSPSPRSADCKISRSHEDSEGVISFTGFNRSRAPRIT